MHENTVTITTFGYLHGPPGDAHLTVDLRTHFQDHLDPELTARDAVVRESVRTAPGVLPLVDAAERAVLAFMAGPPAGPVTVAVGCADGRYGAAIVGDLVATGLAETHGLEVTLTHRDLDKPTVPAHLRPWAAPWSAYRPVDITPPELQAGQGLAASVAAGWAEPHTDPAALPDAAERRAAALIDYDLDAEGRPLHPGGRTDKTGRNLGKWGENAAADPIVVAGTGQDRCVLLIRREDCGQWAIPGGMVDPGETAPAALVRELREETGVDLAGLTPHILARTLVDDPRDSDHAWVATTAALYRLRRPVTAVAADDATDAVWLPFTSLPALQEALQGIGGTLYAAHRPLLATALQHLADA